MWIKLLKNMDLKQTENILDEWNYCGPSMFEAMRRMEGASYVAGTLCELQTSPANSAMYYDAQPRQKYGGLFELNMTTPTKAYYAMKAFGCLYGLGHETVSNYEGEKIHYCAATDGKDIAALICAAKSG